MGDGAQCRSREWDKKSFWLEQKPLLCTLSRPAHILCTGCYRKPIMRTICMYLMMYPGKAWDTDTIYQKTHIAYCDIRVPKPDEHILLCSYKPIVRSIRQNIGIAVFNRKSDPQAKMIPKTRQTGPPIMECYIRRIVLLYYVLYKTNISNVSFTGKNCSECLYK